jgi:hypothetical protein
VPLLDSRLQTVIETNKQVTIMAMDRYQQPVDLWNGISAGAPLTYDLDGCLFVAFIPVLSLEPCAASALVPFFHTVMRICTHLDSCCFV